MLKPAMEKLLREPREHLSPGAAGVSGAITGSQLGAVLAFLSSKVLGQYDPFCRAGRRLHGARRRPAAAGGAEHHLRGARTERGACGLPALGLPARTDPPGAVRRRTVAAPPHAAARSTTSAGCLLGNVDSLMERASAAAKSLKDRAAARRRARPRRHPGPAPGPGGKGGPVPPDGRDEPARRPRQRGHGRRGRQHRPLGEDHPAALQRPRQGPRRRSRNSSAACSAWTPRCASTATAPSSSAKWWTPPAWRASTGSGSPPEHLPTEPEIHDAKLWLDRMGL